MRKKLITFILLCTLIFSSIGFASAAQTTKDFSDLKSSHWAYMNVMSMVDKGVIKGYEDGTFKPNGTLTYGEFIKMVAVEVTGKDVATKGGRDWAVPYYNAAIDAKLLSSNDIPQNYLNRAISRADMAYLVTHAVDTNFDATQMQLLKMNIPDIAKAGNRQDVVAKAYGSGIITGYSDYTFEPVWQRF